MIAAVIGAVLVLDVVSLLVVVAAVRRAPLLPGDQSTLDEWDRPS